MQTVTFRLADSLPQRVLDLWARELEGENRTEADRERRRRIEAYLDAGHGTCWLGDPHLASIVEESLLYFDNDRYRLRAWCVMPNHVHVMIDVWTGHPLHKTVWSWKSWTAKQANARLGRTGAFWHREYYDRFIRDAVHLHNAIAYIEHNPVKARLVSSPADWPWSSAKR